jgi:hypothetical protein
MPNGTSLLAAIFDALQGTGGVRVIIHQRSHRAAIGCLELGIIWLFVICHLSFEAGEPFFPFRDRGAGLTLRQTPDGRNQSGITV